MCLSSDSEPFKYFDFGKKKKPETTSVTHLVSDSLCLFEGVYVYVCVCGFFILLFW